MNERSDGSEKHRSLEDEIRNLKSRAMREIVAANIVGPRGIRYAEDPASTVEVAMRHCRSELSNMAIADEEFRAQVATRSFRAFGVTEETANSLTACVMRKLAGGTGSSLN